MSSKKDGGPSTTNDDAFMAFAFAVISVIAFVMFIPLLYGGTKEIISKIRQRFFGVKPSYKSKLAEEESVFAGGFEDVGTVMENVKYIFTNPGDISVSARAMLSRPRFFTKYVLPRFLRFCFRPKVFVLVLWFSLLSSVLYSTLTYDPYGALGLQQTATFSEVKKAYRNLVSINHPDRNKTAEAKQIWPKIQKAYKTITNKEKGVEEEKEQQEEFSVGVALPSWMLQNEKVTLALILFVLIAVPYFAYTTISQSQGTQLQSIFGRIETANAEMERVLLRMGVPEDRALKQRRLEKRRVFNAMCAIGALEPSMSVSMVDHLPPLKEFRAKLSARNGQQQLRDQHRWMKEGDQQRLLEYFDSTDGTFQRELEQALSAKSVLQPGQTAASTLAGRAALATEAFVLKYIFDAVHRDLEEYSTIIGSATMQAKKILRMQDGVMDGIKELQSQDKPNANRIANELMEAPGKFEELSKEMRVMTERFIEQKQQEKQIEMLREVALQNGGKLPPQLAQQAMEMGLINQQGKGGRKG